ncbi:molybdenum cofactor guanylyltransferase [Pantanalinema rosaneae CENA516]|uniref:molybdenum cofactor guanylyltransferase n=1 Tax=Pantanalinema rosaneae TaxID=1620701 RepID=UPI003D6FC9B0
MSLKQSLSAIVLAGGQSTRMGQDKALMLVHGTPLLHRVCQVALQCTPRVYVVTRSIERYAAIVPPTCQLIQENFPPAAPPQGPLVGFAQGLTHVQTTWVLLLACDLPNLDARMLRSWAEECDRAQTAVALLPRHQDAITWESLCGFYRTDCLPHLQTAIAEGERSFQRWLRSQVVQELPVPDPAILLNCNTPIDLLQVRTQTGIS